MATTRLDEISQAIGSLQQGQHNAEQSRRDHAERTEKQFQSVDDKLDDVGKRIDMLVTALDEKVEKTTSKYFYSTVGGVIAVTLQYGAAMLGIKFPGGH